MLTTLRDIPCRVIITHTWINLWLTNHTLLRSPTEYLNKKIQSFLQITRTITHSRVRSSNAAQSRANAHTTPCVWGPVYFAHDHMSQRSYWKWNIHSNEISIYLVLHIATKNGDFTISEELPTLTLKWKNDAILHLTILTHTLSLKLWRAPIACEYRILWIFMSCNILHVAISEELIAHNTATKRLRIIPSLGSSQIQSLNPAACLPQQIWHSRLSHSQHLLCHNFGGTHPR